MKIATTKASLFRSVALVFSLMFLPIGLCAQHSQEQTATVVRETLPERQSSIQAEVFFPVGSGDLDLDFENNRANLLRFLEQLHRITSDTSCIIRGMVVCGSASPEGKLERNQQLAALRARSLRNYLVSEGQIPTNKIEIVNLGANWSGLKTMVSVSNMPRKEEIISLMDHHGDDYVSLKNAIVRDENGETWDWMYNHFFPKLRMGLGGSCDITLSYDFRSNAKDTVSKSPSNELDAVVDTVKIVSTTDPIVEDRRMRKALFALKTNLLFDAASLLNIEVEIPIGKRFSIAGEVIAPWWLMNDKQHCLQLFSGNVEGRYWFGNRAVTPRGDERKQMTGWFGGLYAGGGYYDLEWDKKGYQGEFFIAAGVSGGYAHTINRSGNLRMEYSLGIGYLQTNYREYAARRGSDEQWHLYRQNNGKFSWFGPTRAKISLVWMLNHNVKQSKGGR